MRRAIDILCGTWQLIRLAMKHRFQMRSPYWQWRSETAFGSDPARWPSFRKRLGAIIEYGIWVHHMKRRL